MTTIYKYQVAIGSIIVKMPKGAQILTAQEQRGLLFIWAIVDTTAELEDRKISVFGTGDPMPDNADVSDWIATVQVGHFVQHVFELF